MRTPTARQTIQNVNLKRFLGTSALTAAALTTMVFAPAYAADDWTNHVASEGTIDINTSIPNETNIGAHGDFVKVSGDGDIKAGWTVNVAQDSSSAKYVLYDIENDPTQIMGNLNANGEIFIFDQNGTIFGANSRVNVGSIVVSTGRMTDADIKDGGSMTFHDVDTAGQIIIDGSITVAEAGLAAFVAPTAVNNGVINAKMGAVALASGNKVTLDLYGDGLIEVAIDQEAADGLVENNGLIKAEGGTVIMSAKAVKDTVDNVVNMSGIIDVSSVEVKGGKIVLSGGNKGVVSISGTLDASGTEGGSVDIRGENVVVTETAEILADATVHGNGGHVKIWGNRNSFFFGDIFARGGSAGGDGGFVEVSAEDSVAYNGLVDTTAAFGETGRFLIDPKHINLGSYSGFTMGSDLFWDAVLGGNKDLMRIDTQALANTLRLTNVDLWATETINTTAEVDISTYEYTTREVVGRSRWGWPIYETTTHSGITGNDLSLSAPTVNLDHNVILGDGGFYLKDTDAGSSALGYGLINAPHDIDIDTLNLNAKILKRTEVDGATSLADNSQFEGIAHTVNVLSNAALIAQGLEFADTDAAVNVAAGTYTENLTIAKDGIKLTGADGAILQAASAGDALITVEGSNVNIDPFVFDGLDLVKFGVKAAGAGADGLVVDGNTFKNMTEAGVHVAANSASSATIKNNTFEGSATRGVRTGTIKGGFTLNITDNIAGSAGTEVKEGFNVGKVQNATVNISGNNVAASEIGVFFRNAIRNNAVVSISGNTVKAGGDALQFYNVNRGGLLQILDNTALESTGANGINFTGSLADATVEIKDNDNIKAAENGVCLDAEIENSTVTLDKNRFRTVTNGAGIYISDTTVGGATVDIRNNSVWRSGTDGIFVNNVPDLTIDNNNVGYYGSGLTAVSGTNVIAGNGISISNADGADITNNNVINTGSHGINVAYSGGATVSGNSVTNAGAQGIRSYYAHNAAINNNTITDALKSGIYALYSSGVSITGNTVDDAGQVGIRAAYAGNSTFNSNIISGATWDGINLNHSGNSTVDGNTVNNSGNYGIQFNYSNDTTVSNNQIDTTGLGGITTAYTTGATISKNTVKNAGTSGIIVMSRSYGAQVLDNVVSDATHHGIETSNTGDFTISGNNVKDSGLNGIYAKAFATNKISIISANIVEGSGRNGIDAQGYDFSITGNDIDNAINGTGIRLANYGGTHLIQNNSVDNTKVGISAHGANLTIDNNNVDTTIENGIDVTGATDVIITNNKVGTDAGADNIGGIGIDVASSAGALVEGNSVDEATTGISVTDSAQARVMSNNVKDSGTGILADNTDNLWVYNNDVTNSATVGIHVKNSDGTNYGGGVNGDIDIWRNRVDSAADATGILVENSKYATVGVHNNNVMGPDGLPMGNVVTGGKDGIVVTGSEYSMTRFNTVDGVSGDGVRVAASDNSVVRDNVISDTGANGVYINGSHNADVLDNTIDDTDGHGIKVNPSDNVEISGNRIHDAGWDGINVIGGSNARIWDNHIGRAGYDGIDVSDNYDVSISDNYIHNSGDNGIEVSGSYDVAIYLNEINGADNDGVNVENSDDAYVSWNTIDNVDHDGITISGSDDVDVFGNRIHDAGNDGISVDGGEYASIEGNHVHRVGDDGIDVDRNYKVDIIGNTVKVTGEGRRERDGNGIEVSNSYDADVRRNYVERAGDDGIDVENSRYADVRNNEVRRSGDDGIDVEDSYGVDINDNHIHGADGDGIEVLNSYDADVRGNRIHYVGDDGIYARNIVWGDVRNNNIHHAKRDGIDVENSNNVDVNDNDVANVGGNGIEVQNSDNANIIGNDIEDTGENGIYADTSDYLVIQDNDIHGADEDGIHVERGYDVDIYDNHIGNSGDDGIDVNRNDFVIIEDNYIHNSGDEGIQVRHAHEFVEVSYNTVETSGENGIWLSNFFDALIKKNKVVDSSLNGVLVEGGEYATIKKNKVKRSGENGISVAETFDTIIKKNKVRKSGNDGINVTNFGFTEITNNKVTKSGDDGIEVANGYATLIAENRIRKSGTARHFRNGDYILGADGIHVRNVGNGKVRFSESEGKGFGIQIIGNDVDKTGDDGIQVLFSGNTLIAGNTVNNAGTERGARYYGGDGISVITDLGFFGHGPQPRVEIVGNDVTNSLDDGIQVIGSNASVLVDDNFVSDSGDNGISLFALGGFPEETESEGQGPRPSAHRPRFPQSFDSVISNNVVQNSGTHGLNVEAGGHDSVEVSGNEFIDNPVGARFESGDIDLTGEGNDFIRGQVGLQFAPFDFGDEIFADMSLVDRTIGTQFFNGQSQYFVELDNGAFYDPGTPTILNGLNSTYVTPFGTIRPSTTLGVLTKDQFDFLENRFYHFSDDGSLGLFFFGFVPGVNQEDIFNQFGSFDVQGSGFNITLNGLPTIPGAGGLANFLANISPAAGGDETGDPTDPESLANIEPAAGGDEVSCWGDAVAAAQSGATVSFSFSGGMEDSVNSSATCSSGSI